jgi:hypothetical protein
MQSWTAEKLRLPEQRPRGRPLKIAHQPRIWPAAGGQLPHVRHESCDNDRETRESKARKKIHGALLAAPAKIFWASDAAIHRPRCAPCSGGMLRA